MNKLEKMKMFDGLSKLLTEYEEAKRGADMETNWEMDLYEMLVEVQNAWGELTGGD